jgi:hypothetical protein
VGGSDAPLTPTLYFTVADEPLEARVTPLTVAVADEARLEPAWLLMTEAKTCPFWSSAIFCAAGVLPLKNAIQLLLIAAMAALPDVGSVVAGNGAEDDGAAADDDPDPEDDPEPEEEDDEGLLLLELQAVTARTVATHARPSRCDRITCLPDRGKPE